MSLGMVIALAMALGYETGNGGAGDGERTIVPDDGDPEEHARCGSDGRVQKAESPGRAVPPIGRLAVRAEDAPRHKNRLPWDKERLYDLYLNDAEWRMARDALNALRSWRFSVGKGDGGTDDALLRVMSAKYKKAPER